MLSIKTQKQQTIINLVSGIMAMAISLAVNFFLSPYIVKTLGEEANGFTQLANNFVTYASLITIAFNSMASRFMSVSYHKGKKDDVQKYYSSVILCNLILCIILIPVSVYIISNINNLIVVDDADVGNIKILFSCVFLNFFINLFLSVLGVSMYITNTIYIQNIITFLRNVLNAVLILCAFTIFPARVYYVSLIAVILTTICIPVTSFFQKRLMPELKFRFKFFSFNAITTILKSGIWNTINQCGNMLMTGVDLLLSNIFINPQSMGLLSVAKIIPNAIMGLATTLNNNFAPALTINWAKGDKKQILAQLRSSMKISSIIITIPIITFCTFGVQFYSLWMPLLDAKKLTILSFLTCMAFIPWAGPQTLYNVFTATDKLKINSIAFVITGIMNVVLVYLSLQFTDAGVYAIAGISSGLSIIRNIIITAPYTAIILKLKWYEFYKDVVNSLVCSAINLVVALPIAKFCKIENWFMLITMILITSVLTLVFDIIFMLKKEERMQLINRIRRKM